MENSFTKRVKSYFNAKQTPPRSKDLQQRLLKEGFFEDPEKSTFAKLSQQEQQLVSFFLPKMPVLEVTTVRAPLVYELVLPFSVDVSDECPYFSLIRFTSYEDTAIID